MNKKYRVFRKGDIYYPQYKGWFSWRNFVQEGNVVAFIEPHNAIRHILNLMPPPPPIEEVVWERP